jgi:predicted nucleotidyltransferase
VISLVEQNRAQIEALCRKYGLKRLELFGSAPRQDFDPSSSDIDFFYEFDPGDNVRLADRFFGLKEELEELLGVAVDLVSARDANNPFFLQVANKDRRTLYVRTKLPILMGELERLLGT